MQNDRRTHGLWEASAPPGPETPALEAAVEADVVIVGGGYTGCSAALHLAQGGARVVLLEAVEIGFGGAGRNVGLVNAGMWVMPDAVGEALGDPCGERLVEQLGEAPGLVFEIIEKHGIDCQATRAGTLHCAVGSRGMDDMRQRESQWRRRGADVELLGPAEAAAKIGTKAYAGALLDRRAGTIQPLAYVRGLAHAAVKAGAAIHAQSAVTSIEDLGKTWRVRTAKGEVTAPSMILATDAFTQHVGTGVRDEQVMLPYFNLATKPLPDDLRATILPERHGAWDSRKILSSLRMDKDGRLVFGSVGALRGLGETIHPDWARRALARLFPQLREVEFDHGWYGMIGMTSDAVPRLHQHGRDAFSISGYNGRGIGPGTTFGRDLARLMLGQIGVDQLSLPLTDMRPDGLRSVKHFFYEKGAEAAHLVADRF